MILMSTALQQSSRASRTIQDEHSCSTLLITVDDEKKNLDPGFAGKFNGQMSP